MITMWSFSAFSAKWEMQFQDIGLVTKAILSLNSSEVSLGETLFVISVNNREKTCKHFVKEDSQHNLYIKNIYEKFGLKVPTYGVELKIESEQTLENVLTMLNELAPVDDIRESIALIFKSSVSDSLPVVPNARFRTNQLKTEISKPTAVNPQAGLQTDRIMSETINLIAGLSNTR